MKYPIGGSMPSLVLRPGCAIMGLPVGEAGSEVQVQVQRLDNRRQMGAGRTPCRPNQAGTVARTTFEGFWFLIAGYYNRF